MADAEATTPRSERDPQDTPEREPGEWALIANSHMNAAVDMCLLVFATTDLPAGMRDALLRVVVDAAKLAGVLEWLGEGLVALTEDARA